MNISNFIGHTVFIISRCEENVLLNKSIKFRFIKKNYWKSYTSLKYWLKNFLSLWSWGLIIWWHINPRWDISISTVIKWNGWSRISGNIFKLIVDIYVRRQMSHVVKTQVSIGILRHPIKLHLGNGIKQMYVLQTYIHCPFLYC